MTREPTDPRYSSPELNGWRLQQLTIEHDRFQRQHAELVAKVEAMSAKLIEYDVELKHTKESRSSQGKRLGSLEGDMSDLKGLKKLLAAVGTIGILAIGAFLKSLF